MAKGVLLVTNRFVLRFFFKDRTMLTALTCDILRVVVNIYTQPGNGAQLANDCRHEHFVVLPITEPFPFGWVLCEDLAQLVRSKSRTKTEL